MIVLVLNKEGVASLRTDFDISTLGQFGIPSQLPNALGPSQVDKIRQLIKLKTQTLKKRTSLENL